MSKTPNQRPQKGPKGPKGPTKKGPVKLKPQKTIWSNLFTTILIFITIAALYSLIVDNQTQTEQIAISQLAQDVREGKVERIEVEGEDLLAEYKKEEGEGEEVPVTVKESKKEAGTALSDTLANYGVSPEQLASVAIDIKSPSGFLFWLTVLAPFILPILFIVILIWYLSRQVKGSGMQAFTFGQSKARIIDPKDGKQKVTFKDVAGVKEAKEELTEIVDFLKYPKKFLDIGARIPKGVLLMGAPGTGKTLLARAVAGEAGVSFFSISGSEFVEMFVGVGASRVRDLFKLAKTAAPAIIFIDEIDAVGRARGVGVGGGNDEREQTLNQILVEMDGFEPNEKVIVMAATNRPDVLDPAILRPGRFDRRVSIDLPDRNDREEIMKIHAKGKPVEDDIDLKLIASRTPGFSGADLYSLVNEAAILAARENRKKVSQFDLIRSIEKVMLGPERKSHLLSKKEKEITAYHEAGHALVASCLPDADPVHKISIISRGKAGGYTLKIPEKDVRLQQKAAFKADIAMTLGGYVTEQEVFGDITTGPSNDLQVVTSMARSMVTRFGMSDELGPIAYSKEPGNPGFPSDKNYSDKVANKIDEEVKRLVNDGMDTAREIITSKRNVLDAIAKKLIEVETIERDEYEEILVEHGITPPKREEETKEVSKEKKEDK
jgi:cell division protease FtsH